jgi:ribonuclease P protein component
VTSPDQAASRPQLVISTTGRFPASARVRDGAVFRQIQRTGTRVGTRHFVFVVGESPTGARALGVTASRKVGNSVERNRVKRLLRECFRRTQNALPARTALIVICRQELPHLTLVEVTAAFEQALPRIVKAAKSWSLVPP